jgi:hypothetical protein
MGHLIHINDENAHLFCEGGHGAIGKKFGWIGKKPGPSPFRAVRDAIPLIPRGEWKDRINEGQGNFLSDFILASNIPVKDQDGLGYCWVYASTTAVEVVRALEGLPLAVLSPESVGGPITGWRNEGGYGEDACKQLADAGACLESFMDAPNSLSHKRWKAGWEADCANHKIDHEWWDVTTFDEIITLLLARQPVSVGLDWWGHQVCFTDPVILDNGEVGVKFRNSWGDWGEDGFGTLTESKSQPDGAFCPRIVTPSAA